MIRSVCLRVEGGKVQQTAPCQGCGPTKGVVFDTRLWHTPASLSLIFLFYKCTLLENIARN